MPVSITGKFHGLYMDACCQHLVMVAMQGYKIIGSHSGVKLCRWTKSQLRGRGGCYKHSFYGIESHRQEFYASHPTMFCY